MILGWIAFMLERKVEAHDVIEFVFLVILGPIGLLLVLNKKYKQ